jgi:hypothetical protein
MMVASIETALAVQYANLEKFLQRCPNNSGTRSAYCGHLVSKEWREQNGQYR